ncbi:MAG: hypothetical protein K0R03_62 [Moraxellaceae bacterium]|jgi:hypothetical protein|nr:hypothetical protein [Moraxellaceae bacterium]
MDTGRDPAALPLYETPALREATWRRWRHPVVRDLAWVLASPPLLQPSGTGLRWLNDAWGERAFRASEGWLAALDQHPAPLRDVLARRPGRLGTYFETLLLFWLSWPGNPLYRLVAHNLPVRTKTRTLGELDFLVEERASGALQHWEVAVKFYLGVAPGGAHAGWIGPGLKDRLDLKVERLLQHQLGLTSRPEAVGLLRHLGLPMPKPVCLLRGRLFYPPHSDLAAWAPDGAAAGHLTGWWMPQQDFLALYADAGLQWIRLPKEHWLTPVDLDAPDTDAVPIGASLEANRLVEALRAAADNRAAAVVGLLDRQEVTRGFITPADWPSILEPA